MMRDTGRAQPSLERGPGQGFPGGDAFSQRRKIVVRDFAEHVAKGGRGGKADRGLKLSECGQEFVWTRFL
jgi:hypothetical protein